MKLRDLNWLSGNPFVVAFDQDGGHGGGPGEKTFTQSQLDAILTDRISRVKKSAGNDAIKEYLANAGLDEDQFTKLVENNTPEKDLEIKKLNAAMSKMQKQFDEAMAEKDAASKALTDMRMESAAHKLLSEYCDDGQAKIAYGSLRGQLTLGENGLETTDGTKAEEFIPKWLESNPFLKRAQKVDNRPPPPASPNPNDDSGKEKKFEVPYADSSGRRERLEKAIFGD